MERNTCLLLRLLEPDPNTWPCEFSAATSAVDTWNLVWPDRDRNGPRGPKSSFFESLLPPLSFTHGMTIHLEKSGDPANKSLASRFACFYFFSLVVLICPHRLT